MNSSSSVKLQIQAHCFGIVHTPRILNYFPFRLFKYSCHRKMPHIRNFRFSRRRNWSRGSVGHCAV